MRTKIALCVMAAIAMNSPLMADIGEIQLHLTSGGSNGTVFIAHGAGAVVPVEVSFTATTSGTSGSNRGVAGLNVQLNTGLPLIDQQPMTLNPLLIAAHGNFNTTIGLGFTSFPDGGVAIDNGGDIAKETIDSVGAFQGLLADFDFTNTVGKFKHGPMAENVGHAGTMHPAAAQGPVLLATGGILVDSGTPEGTYVMTVIPLAAVVWDTKAGQAEVVPFVGTSAGTVFEDTLTIIVVPEPATMLLLAPVAWAIRRRNRNNA